ncbi:histidine kinase [Streptomyces sp. NPDC056987]|uniref:histidine kinase n=1 Tax=Streptomyces sp. NPDC056987 TaxID=3345988 RepID=UPI003640F820
MADSTKPIPALRTPPRRRHGPRSSLFGWHSGTWTFRWISFLPIPDLRITDLMFIDPVVISTVAGSAVLLTGSALVITRRRLMASGRELLKVKEDFRTTGEKAASVHATALAQAKQRSSAAERSARERYERLEKEYRDRVWRLEQVVLEEEHLRTVRIPGLLVHLRAPHMAVPGLMHEGLAGTSIDVEHRAVLEAISRGVREEGERADEAGLAVVRGVLAKAHSLHLRMQDQIREIVERYPDADPVLMRAVLGLDMHNEVIGRALQTPAVACGAPALLFREQTHLIDVVLSAASRVHGFHDRIQEPANHLVRRIGVAEQHVEALRIIASALLANAVECSHSTLRVSVELHEAPAGVSVTIDDPGVGLNAEQLARGRWLVSGARAVRLVELGDPPKAGWAAVGMLVRQHGFHVSLGRGRHGGVSAVIHIPNALLVEMPTDEKPSVLAPEPVSAAPAPVRSGPVGLARHAAGPTEASDGEAGGLPTRRRRAPEPAEESRSAAGAVVEHRSPQEAGRVWGAWRAGQQEGLALVEHSRSGDDELDPSPRGGPFDTERN